MSAYNNDNYHHHRMLLLRLAVLDMSLKDACEATITPGHPNGMRQQSYQTSKGLVEEPKSVMDLITPNGSIHLGKFIALATTLDLADGPACDGLAGIERQYNAVRVLFAKEPTPRILQEYARLLKREPTDKDRIRVRLAYLEQFHGVTKQDVADRADVELTSFQQYMNSTISKTSPELVKRYAAPLKIKPEFLLADGYPVQLINAK